MRETREHRITRLLRIAADTFTRLGYHGASMRTIATEAGFVKGNLYYYFQSKEEMLLAILLHTLDHLTAGLEEVLERRGTASERLLRAIRHHAAFAASHGGLLSLVLEARHLSLPSRTQVQKKHEEYVGLLEEVFRSGVVQGEFYPVDPRVAAAALISTCNYLVLHELVLHEGRQRQSPAELAEAIYRLVADPLLRPSSLPAFGEGSAAGPKPSPGKEKRPLVLGDLIRRNARLYPDKPAFIMDRTSVTFAEYNGRVNRLISALSARSIRPGDRLAILSRNSLAYFDVYGAAEKGGFIIAPLNFRLTAGELVKVLEEVQPRVLFVQAPFRHAVEAIRESLTFVDLYVATDSVEASAEQGWVPLEKLLAEGTDSEPEVTIAPDDVSYLIFTSGTTGLPRAVMLTHEGQWLNAMTIALEMALTPRDRHLATMPLYHVGGRALVLAHTLRGCTVVLHDGFDTARVLEDIEKHRITTTQVVPTMVAWMLDHPDLHRRDLSSLRLVWYASAPMPVELLRRALAAFGPIFIQGYGQTESGPLVTTLHPDEHETEGPGAARLASCGRPVPGAEVRIVGADGADLPPGEVGEIAVRSPFLMAGYWGKPEVSAQVLRDGWLYTGDMGKTDRDGYLYIVDRKKDMIISGGENIYPREIEEVLYQHPAVLEAAVIGVPDPVWGESVKALVVLRPGRRASAEELTAFCRERLAGYKVPKSVEFLESLPKSPSGKILKRMLRDAYWKEGERKV